MESQTKDKLGQIERYIEFNLGTERYAVTLLQVLEVISIPQTTPVPNSPPYTLGVMNLRGKIISIIDIRKKLNIPPLEKNDEVAVIIINLGETNIGIIVDSINRVLSVNESELDNAVEIQGQINAKYIKGVYHSEEKLTFLIDPYELFKKDLPSLNKLDEVA